MKKDRLTDQKILSTISYDFSNNKNQEARLFFGNTSEMKETKSTRNLTPLDRSFDGLNLRAKNNKETDKNPIDSGQATKSKPSGPRNLDMPL